MATVHTTAGVLSTQPVNPNFLSPLNFRFSMKRAPNLNFFVVRATLPGLSIKVSEQPSPYKYLPLPGNKITYGEFSIVYRVDENFANYLEIHNWMSALGHTDGFYSYDKLANANMGTGKGTVSDATLTVLDSAKNPRTEIVFHDMFPVDIGSIWFNVDAPTVTHVTNEVKFKFLKYEIIQLPYT